MLNDSAFSGYDIHSRIFPRNETKKFQKNELFVRICFQFAIIHAVIKKGRHQSEYVDIVLQLLNFELTIFHNIMKKTGMNSVTLVKGGEADAKGDLGTGLHQ